MPTLTKQKTPGRPRHTDRDQLLESAKEHFAARGFDGATTRSLANAMNCNVALISYYFDGKDGLYQEILKRHFDNTSALFANQRKFSEKDLAQWKDLKSDDQKRLCQSLFLFAESLLNNKTMLAIVMREVMTGAKNIIKAAASSNSNTVTQIEGIIEDLQKRNVLSKNLNIKIAILALVSPVIYSMIASPILKAIYKFKAIDTTLMRELCSYSTQNLFRAWPGSSIKN